MLSSFLVSQPTSQTALFISPVHCIRSFCGLILSCPSCCLWDQLLPQKFNLQATLLLLIFLRHQNLWNATLLVPLNYSRVQFLVLTCLHPPTDSHLATKNNNHNNTAHLIWIHWSHGRGCGRIRGNWGRTTCIRWEVTGMDGGKDTLLFFRGVSHAYFIGTVLLHQPMMIRVASVAGNLT